VTDQSAEDTQMNSASRSAPPDVGGTVHERAPQPTQAQHSDTSEVTQADIDALVGASGNPSAGGAADTLLGSAHAPVAADVAPAHGRDGTSRQPPMKPYDFAELSDSVPSLDMKRISMLSDVNLNVKIELGRTRMLVEEVLKLGHGSVVELDKLAGDPVDVYANERLVARGEVLVLNDSFCVRINEVLSRDPHRVSPG